MLDVLVRGIAGRMGKVAAETVISSEKHNLVAGIDLKNAGTPVSDIDGLQHGPENKVVRDFNELDSDVKQKIDIMIDFTAAEGLVSALERAANYISSLIVGTTGLTEEQREKLKNISDTKGCAVLLAPNFSLGAVLLKKFSREAVRYFSKAEIIEAHHQEKRDTPSGTANMIADDLKEEINRKIVREGNFSWSFNSDEKLAIHSLRLPGVISCHKVIFGDTGQTFTMSHNASSLEACRPGLKIALKKIYGISGFVFGLENILD